MNSLTPDFLSGFTNPVAFSSVLLVVLGGFMAVFGMVYSQVYDYVYRRFVVSLEVSCDSQSYSWLQHWIEQQKFFHDTRNISVADCYEEVEQEQDPEEIVQRVKIVPATGEHYFMYKGKYIWMTKTVEPRNNRSDNKKIVMRCFDRSTKTLLEILNDAREMEIERTKAKVVINVPNNGYWEMKASKSKRPMESVVLDPTMKGDIIADIQLFLNSKNWYLERGLPYRRGYLFHGPPGCGKSSILAALAGYFGLNLCIFSASKMDDAEFNMLMQSVPARSAVLMEDVDCIFAGRSGESGPGGISFSTFLNAIDGVAAGEGRILFLTTNHPEKLSKALIRPGRVDKIFKFGLATQYQIETMFSIFYPEAPQSVVKEFSSLIPAEKYSPASLQGHLLNNRDGYQSAIDNIKDLLESINHQDSFEEEKKDESEVKDDEEKEKEIKEETTENEAQNDGGEEKKEHEFSKLIDVE